MLVLPHIHAHATPQFVCTSRRIFKKSKSHQAHLCQAIVYPYRRRAFVSPQLGISKTTYPNPKLGPKRPRIRILGGGA